MADHDDDLVDYEEVSLGCYLHCEEGNSRLRATRMLLLQYVVSPVGSLVRNSIDFFFFVILFFIGGRSNNQ
jgi:hypothetical protein